MPRALGQAPVVGGRNGQSPWTSWNRNLGRQQERSTISVGIKIRMGKVERHAVQETNCGRSVGGSGGKGGWWAPPPGDSCVQLLGRDAGCGEQHVRRGWRWAGPPHSGPHGAGPGLQIALSARGGPPRGG